MCCTMPHRATLCRGGGRNRYWIARLRERLGRRRVARVGTFAFTDDIAEQFDAAAAGPVVPGTGTGDAPPPQ